MKYCDTIMAKTKNFMYIARKECDIMLMKQMLEVFEILDDENAGGQRMKQYFQTVNPKARVETFVLQGEEGSTDVIRILIPGSHGKMSGGTAPTLGIIGRLGGLGARPVMKGFVSDGDGALAALTAAAKLLDMQKKGDILEGDVIVATHICPDAPTQPHEPVPFMGSPIEMDQNNEAEVMPEMDAILSIDTTKGNRVINHRGFAISNTVKEGYILSVSEDLLDIIQTTTGRLPAVFPLATQDITPYGNDLYHLNSILQPATSTKAPVVGVAITTETMVAGCATGASHACDVEDAARFAVETAKYYGSGKCHFYDQEQFERLNRLYGDMRRLQTLGIE